MPPKAPKKADEGGGEGQKSDLDAIRELTAASAVKFKLDSLLAREQSLLAENTRLSDALAAQKRDQSEIFEYLNREVNAKAEEITRLDLEVVRLTEANQAAADKFVAELREAAEKAANAESELELKLESANRELASLATFRQRKIDLENELEEAKATIAAERSDHKAAITEMERSVLQEKDRLRKEMQAKLRETKNMFMKMTDSQLEATTKRTIVENDQMSSELAFQSREAEKLIVQNKKLCDENKDLRMQAQMSSEMSAELARRNNAYLGTIRKVVKKVKSMEQERQIAEKKLADAEASQMSQSDKLVYSLQSELEQCKRGRAALQEQCQTAQAELSRIQSLRDEVSRFLLQCMNDLKMQMAKAAMKEEKEGTGKRLEEEAIPELGNDVFAAMAEQQVLSLFDLTPAMPRLDDLPVAHRERVLRVLFAKLAAFHVMRAEPQTDKKDDSLLVFPPLRPEENTAPHQPMQPAAPLSGRERGGDRPSRRRMA